MDSSSPIELNTLTKLDIYFSFGFGVVEMGDRFRDREEPMYVVIERIGEEILREVEGGYAGIRNDRNDLSLPVFDRANIAIEDLLEISDRLAVPPVRKRGAKFAQLREAYKIFRQGSKTFLGIYRVGRKYRVRRDAFQNTIAADQRAIRFADE